MPRPQYLAGKAITTTDTYRHFGAEKVASWLNSLCIVVSYIACGPSRSSSVPRFHLLCSLLCLSPLRLRRLLPLPDPHWIRCSPTHVSGLVASEKGDRCAWVENVRGVRNIWSAGAADTEPRQLTHYTADDGQELTQLTFSADGTALLYVRGGDHDQNWPAQGNLAPNPDNSTSEAKVTIWSVSLADSASKPVQVAEGDSPALSSTGQLAYVKDGQIWTAPLPGGSNAAAKAQRLFF